MKSENELRNRTKIVLFIIFALAGVGVWSVSSWIQSTENEVRSMYPIEKSKNPEASKEFLEAMEYRIYIKELHPFFDYDSFIMAPLLSRLNKHFQKGKALLPHDSVEDIVWWVLFYKEIYGLLAPPRNDNSLAFEKLPPEKFAQVQEQVYTMIERYPYGKVYFDIDEIKKFRFKTMAVLVSFFYKKYGRKYDEKSRAKREIIEHKDPEATERLAVAEKNYEFTYTHFFEESSNKAFMEREYQSDRIYMAADLIVKYTFLNNTQELPYRICYSEDVTFIIEHTAGLIDFVTQNSSLQAHNIKYLLFKRGVTNVPELLKLLKYKCKNLEPEISDIVQRVEHMNMPTKQRSQ